MITLLIARHGNTFEKGQTPTRVGKRTDLPLTQKGEEQALALGQWIKGAGYVPDACYCSTLQRTQKTATLALQGCNPDLTPVIDPLFDEIDYGPDENKPESDVIARIGKEAIENWDQHAISPEGWLVDPDQITAGWQNFVAGLLELDVSF